ncbi:MAG: hypothetical protein COZ06_08385 [Armatimonadetes bacterium CG_4_10_14_3_um_filter_66_18]|nr:hypothetical protein [Armatimonadota bacterium]OIO99172.1 MAG: hypothetical protein AUJ96_19870 [Armatimonadetes bacterium CG2_30_66_41]PIU90752.1 MAG: hypothetical protein COS65_24215 [Armatimonadetes bacterium CG06_land_8_20_14_3_00_66_21]PIW12969.1 MAG: hypothetical protein COW34_12235 [Armatimonadetes bacterium CG17_big_fil_post_rev_8_21_14_2_50_66_6]PIX37533.1 MAG: hypothetical protein COZ57_33860 [Armatimonadetes bacterium CG_4_8_14_3_um_filter_66_20]PIY50626.1 MAG: hypothetical prote
MKTAYICLAACLLAGVPMRSVLADAPRNIGVPFNGETDGVTPLAAGRWHTITAAYRYPGKIGLLTNTFVVLAKGNNLLAGLDVGYNLPANEPMIIKHGFWNATEATGRWAAMNRCWP